MLYLLIKGLTAVENTAGNVVHAGSEKVNVRR